MVSSSRVGKNTGAFSAHAVGDLSIWTSDFDLVEKLKSMSYLLSSNRHWTLQLETPTWRWASRPIPSGRRTVMSFSDSFTCKPVLLGGLEGDARPSSRLAAITQ